MSGLVEDKMFRLQVGAPEEVCQRALIRDIMQKLDFVSTSVNRFYNPSGGDFNQESAVPWKSVLKITVPQKPLELWRLEYVGKKRSCWCFTGATIL